MGTLVTRRTLLISSMAAFAAQGLAAGTHALKVDDGNAHGDPPFLLEAGWLPLLK
jgi:NhaP-type Na+/H+ or K+/H+ antiporter